MPYNTNEQDIITEQNKITEQGNPGKPEGEAGKAMLERMNRSHYEVTGWGLGFVNPEPDADILDIGCGGGVTLSRLAKLAPKGHICGIDYSEVSVRKSVEYNDALIKAGRIEVKQGSVEKMMWSDCAFDLITTVESFYFWPEPAENLREVLRVLKSGGVFLLIADINGSADLSEHEIKNVEKYALFNPTVDEFKSLFVNAGFSSVEIHLK